VSAAQPAPASVAEEIERQVAERTADLAAANDRLRREVEIHQRTADALRASEAGVRLLVDGIPALAVALSASGAIEHANQPTLTYFGVDFDEFKARIGRDLIHPHDIARSTQIFDESIAAGVPCEIEHRLQRFDGVHRWHLTRAMPLRDASGRIEHWYVLNTDIDERKRVEDQLRVRELSARLLVESMESIPAFAIVANEVGEIVYANRQVLEYYGRTLEEVKAWPTSVHIVHPDDLDHANQVVSNSLAAGVGYADEYRLQRFDGVYRWFEGRGLPVRDDAGRVINWYILLIDIDDRKRAENLVAAENRMLEMVARGQPPAAVLHALCNVVQDVVDDSRCAIQLVDPGGTRLEWGASPDIPATFFTIARDDAADAVWGPCGTTVASRTDVLVADIEAETRWPQWRTATRAHGFRSCWTTPIVSRSDEALGAFALYRPVAGSPTQFQRDLVVQFAQIASIAIERTRSDTALDKVRADLAHASRVVSLGVLTASIAHEVNQPLAGIITNASTCLRMLAGDPPNLDGARATAQRALRDGNRAADVIQRLRALFAHEHPVIETVDLNDAAREVLALAVNELQGHRVILNTDFDEALPAISGDRVQLQQVVLNLVLNAADAMKSVDDRPRDLLVATARDDDSVRLSVRDAGIGIDPQAVEKLFDAFFTTKAAGMGVGLSVSRSIIERHNGRLWASANDGHGATFSFSVPRVPAQ